VRDHRRARNVLGSRGRDAEHRILVDNHLDDRLTQPHGANGRRRTACSRIPWMSTRQINFERYT
jgi:hypothetical protein